MYSAFVGTLNSRRAASTLLRLVEGEGRWEVPHHSQGVLPQNWSETEPNSTVTCMFLRVAANDGRTIQPPCRNEFGGP
ncbi:hypothetical protein TNCV_977031 [Trichonephila clavipes]|nr:hypothetical protein TNCV_977031 [Trichonephila clavipes]